MNRTVEDKQFERAEIQWDDDDEAERCREAWKSIGATPEEIRRAQRERVIVKRRTGTRSL